MQIRIGDGVTSGENIIGHGCSPQKLQSELESNDKLYVTLHQYFIWSSLHKSVAAMAVCATEKCPPAAFPRRPEPDYQTTGFMPIRPQAGILIAGRRTSRPAVSPM